MSYTDRGDSKKNHFPINKGHLCVYAGGGGLGDFFFSFRVTKNLLHIHRDDPLKNHPVIPGHGVGLASGQVKQSGSGANKFLMAALSIGIVQSSHHQDTSSKKCCTAITETTEMAKDV